MPCHCTCRLLEPARWRACRPNFGTDRRKRAVSTESGCFFNQHELSGDRREDWIYIFIFIDEGGAPSRSRARARGRQLRTKRAMVTGEGHRSCHRSCRSQCTVRVCLGHQAGGEGVGAKIFQSHGDGAHSDRTKPEQQQAASVRDKWGRGGRRRGVHGRRWVVRDVAGEASWLRRVRVTIRPVTTHQSGTQC